MGSDDIQGTATDVDGNVIANAIVALWLQDNPSTVTTTQADSNGNYIFEDHPDGDGTSQTWHLAARDPNDSSRQFASLHTVSASLPSPSTVPDSDHSYDATQISANDGDTVSTWTDQAGSADLTAGTSPTYKTGVLNNNPVVRFDGADDYLNNSLGAYSQPVWKFIVFVNFGGGNYITDSNSTNNFAFVPGNTGGNWRMQAGNIIGTGSADGNAYLFSLYYNGASSVMRKNGTEILSADVGGNSLDGLTVGANDSANNQATVDIGQLDIINGDLTTSERDAKEQDLADKWGITI